jgi:predicted kinase
MPLRAMVIFLAGNIGTGKTSLAKVLAGRLAIPHYEVDYVKKAVVSEDSRLQWNVLHNVPFPEEARIKMFTRVVEDFARLAKDHPHLIVDETLHKEGPRQILLDGAVRYFGSYLMVLVEADEARIMERLMDSEREEHVLSDPMGMYHAIKREFDPFDRVDIRFKNNMAIDKAAARLERLIRARLEAAASTSPHPALPH